MYVSTLPLSSDTPKVGIQLRTSAKVVSALIIYTHITETLPLMTLI